jgi:hypothetical protein
MSSAATPPSALFSSIPSPLNEVQALCRRVCVLRSTGAFVAADRIVADELPRAVAALRETVTITDAELQALYAAEEERVADARALAEILLPMLSEAPARRTRSPFAAVESVKAEAAGTTDLVAASSALPDPIRSSPTTAPLPGIADFIDEMLTQDRSKTRPNGTRRSA